MQYTKVKNGVNSHSDKEVVSSIKSYFPGTDEAVLITSIKNYRNINAFSTNPTLTTENLTKLMDIIQSYKSSLIPTRPDFDKIVNTTFSKKTVTDIK